MRSSLDHVLSGGMTSTISLTPFTRFVIIALMILLSLSTGLVMDVSTLVMALGLLNIGVIVFLLLRTDITWGFIFYLTAVIFFQTGFWIRLPSFPDLYPGRVASILIYLVFLGQVLLSMREAPKLGRVEKAMLFFLVVLFISVLTSGQRPRWLTLMRGYIYPFLFYYFARAVIIREGQIRIVCGYLALIGVYFGVMGILEKLKLYDLVWPKFIVDPSLQDKGLSRLGFRVRGIFLQPAVLGAVMTMGFFPAWHYLSRIRGMMPKIVRLMLLIVTPITIFFTQTRSVYAGLLFALVNTAVWSRKLRPLCIGIILAAMVGAFLSWDNLSTGDRDVGGIGDMGTVHYRVIVFLEAVEVFMDHPFFGCGFMNFQELAKDYRRPRDVPLFGYISLPPGRDAVSHNILVTIFAEQGLLGVVPYFLIFFFFFQTSWAAFRALPREGLISKDFVVCVWAGMIAYMTNAMFMEMRYFEYINVLFFFLMGMMMGIYERYATGRADALIVAAKPVEAPPPTRVPVVAGGGEAAMRIAFVADYPDDPGRVVGGVPAVVHRLATAMASRPGLEVHAVSFHRGLVEPVDEVVQGVRVHRFPATRHLGNVTFGRNERRATAAALRRISPDVAHVHWLGPPALGTAESGVPWVATAHGLQTAEGKILRGWVNRVRARSYTAMERMSLRSLEHLIVISPYVLEYFGTRVNGIKTHAIENPVEERFFGIREPGDPATILFTGRLIPRKDVETLVDAAELLAARGHEFRLRIIGGPDDPAYGEELQRRAVRRGVAAAVEFLGAVSAERHERELARAGVFVLSSKEETSPVAIMEAMAAGRAVVSTDVGGTRHLVEDGVSGRLVPVGSPSDLADGLSGYLRDPERTRGHGGAGRRIAERRFRLDRIVDATLQVYEEVVADARRGIGESTGSRARNRIESLGITPDGK